MLWLFTDVMIMLYLAMLHLNSTIDTAQFISMAMYVEHKCPRQVYYTCSGVWNRIPSS